MEADDDFDLSIAPAKAIAEKIGVALRELLERPDVTQESLAVVLGYATQGSVSKILNESQHLPPERAARLDQAGFGTGCRYTFAELARAGQLARKRPARRRNIKRRHDVFLASPMASATDYATTRETAYALARKIEDWTGLSVYYAGMDIRSDEHFDSPDVAFQENLNALLNSRYFVLFLPEKVSGPSSIWVEAGMALAMEMDSTYFVPHPDALPYILNRATQPPRRGGSGVVAVHWMKDNARLPFNLVEKHGEGLFRHRRPGRV